MTDISIDINKLTIFKKAYEVYSEAFPLERIGQSPPQRVIDEPGSEDFLVLKLSWFWCRPNVEMVDNSYSMSSKKYLIKGKEQEIDFDKIVPIYHQRAFRMEATGESKMLLELYAVNNLTKLDKALQGLFLKFLGAAFKLTTSVILNPFIKTGVTYSTGFILEQLKQEQLKKGKGMIIEIGKAVVDMNADVSGDTKSLEQILTKKMEDSQSEVDVAKLSLNVTVEK